MDARPPREPCLQASHLKIPTVLSMRGRGKYGGDSSPMSRAGVCGPRCLHSHALSTPPHVTHRDTHAPSHARAACRSQRPRYTMSERAELAKEKRRKKFKNDGKKKKTAAEAPHDVETNPDMACQRGPSG